MNIPSFFTGICMLITFHIESPSITTNPHVAINRDFFKDSKFVHTAWLGFLQSKDTKRVISNVPMFIYENKAEGYGKIVCVPKAPDNWTAKFKGKTKVEKISIGKTLTQGILNNSIGEKDFNIYSFFTNADDLLANPDFSKPSTPKFPSTVYIYIKAGTKWNIIAQKLIKNLAEYSDLQFRTANGVI
ncbi:hypothetical protein [Pedobacter paludis]|nr:hypothetical protein [Pedobacter paludis]